MSHETYRRMEARIKLQSKLLVAEKQVAEGEPLLDYKHVMARMPPKSKIKYSPAYPTNRADRKSDISEQAGN